MGGRAVTRTQAIQSLSQLSGRISMGRHEKVHLAVAKELDRSCVPGNCQVTLAHFWSLLFSQHLITAFTPVSTVTYLKPGCLCCRRTQQGFVLSCSRQFSWTVWGSASQPLREFACEWAWLWSHWWDGERNPSHSEANENINPSWPSFPGRIPRLSPPPTSNPALTEMVGTASFPPAGCLLPRLPGTPPQPALSSPQAHAAWKPFPFLSRDLPADGQCLL